MYNSVSTHYLKAYVLFLYSHDKKNVYGSKESQLEYSVQYFALKFLSLVEDDLMILWGVNSDKRNRVYFLARCLESSNFSMSEVSSM